MLVEEGPHMMSTLPGQLEVPQGAAPLVLVGKVDPLPTVAYPVTVTAISQIVPQPEQLKIVPPGGHDLVCVEHTLVQVAPSYQSTLTDTVQPVPLLKL
jgi:hypothetical protein